MTITPDLLRRAGVRNPEPWAVPLAAAMAAFEITTIPRQASFLATTLHESGNCTVLVENLNYTPDGLMATWPSRFPMADAQRFGRTSQHAADQWHIAERAYAGRMGNRPEGAGDGFAYRGRGLIQHTGRDAYEAEAKATGRTLASVPAWLESITGACQSAARFWRDAGCNEMVDAGNARGARVRVNGGTIGLDDVMARNALLLGLLGGQTPPPLTKPVPVAPAQVSVPDADAALRDQVAAAWAGKK